MAIMPGAVWRGNCANNSGNRGGSTRGLVLHVNDGPNVDLWSWVNSPTSNMSCHFQVLQDGTVYQYLDTDLWSWCQADGNQLWLSVEMPTVPGEAMTAAQVAAGARILAWAAKTHGFPLELATGPDGAGFGWHGMGGAAWGGHTGCPGDIRRGQMPGILAAARGTATTPGDDMSAQAEAMIKDLHDRLGKIDTLAYQMSAQAVPAIAAIRGVVVDIDAVAHRVDSTLNDPTSGTHVRVAALQAALGKLGTDVAAEIAKIVAPAGGLVDEAALAKAVADEIARRMVA